MKKCLIYRYDWNTYIAVDYFHFSGKSHGGGVRRQSEMRSLLSSQVCVQVLWTTSQK